MSHTENDHKAIAFLSPKHFAEEAKLFETKWWDYRLLHPADATERFAQDYIDAVKSYLKKQIDLYVGTNAPVLKKEDFFLESKATITGMWKARQLADKHGVPYSFWCHRAMDYADKCCWPYYPKPSHLYSDKAKETLGDLEGISMVEFILAAWKEWSGVRVLKASDGFYYSAENIEHPYFVDHQHSLMHQIERSNVSEHVLAIHLYDNADLLEEFAREHFDESMMRKAKELSL